MAKLSIIIPYYNTVETIEKLLDSILDECKDAQIIVVDDNSNKGTEAFDEIKKKYAPYAEFYLNDSGNKGAGAARNVGVLHARGEWLLFADSDDYMLAGWYDAVSRYFESDHDVVFFDSSSVDLATNEESDRNIYYNELVDSYIESGYDHNREINLRYYYVVPWGKLIRKSVVDDNDIRFDEIRNFDDVMFSVMTGFHAKKIFADPAHIYCITLRDGSLSRDESEDIFALGVEVFCRRNLYLREHLTKEDYSFYIKKMGAVAKMAKAVRRKSGLNDIIGYLSMYRRYKVPLFKDILRILRLKIDRLTGREKER